MMMTVMLSADHVLDWTRWWGFVGVWLSYVREASEGICVRVKVQCGVCTMAVIMIMASYLGWLG